MFIVISINKPIRFTQLDLNLKVKSHNKKNPSKKQDMNMLTLIPILTLILTKIIIESPQSRKIRENPKWCLLINLKNQMKFKDTNKLIIKISPATNIKASIIKDMAIKISRIIKEEIKIKSKLRRAMDMVIVTDRDRDMVINITKTTKIPIKLKLIHIQIVTNMVTIRRNGKNTKINKVKKKKRVIKSVTMMASLP